MAPGSRLSAAAQRANRARRERRSRWRLVLLVGGGVLALYYVLVFAGMRTQDTSEVVLEGSPGTPSSDGITVQIGAARLDTATGELDLRLRPVPHRELAAERRGQLREPLEIEVSSPGELPIGYDFPAEQVVDPVGATVAASTGAHRFPFDQPKAEIRFEAVSEGRLVPVDVEVSDGTEGWNLSGSVREVGERTVVELDARRDVLAISFALFYVAGIVVVALITVAVIGGAVARGRVGFEQVIWLAAMLVVIPAVRNEIPGVPPLGVAIDLFVFLPSVVIVGLALLAAIVVLVINEAAASAVITDGEPEA